MVTEPHTIAKTRSQQIFYASFIILFPLVFSFLNLYNIPPELSLLIGNLLSFVISHRARYILKLKDIKNLNQDQKEYLFKNTQDTKIPNKAGEYMEWLLPHKSVDSRGQRRYFTISSAPGANEISFATKFPPEKESSFKHALKDVQPGDTMYATQLGGDFLLPGKLNKNIIMLAGGIGITPFIAQLRDLLNKPENKIENLSLALFYCVKSKNDITFEDVLKEAVQKLKLKVVCVVTDTSDNNTIPEFFYESGYMSKEILKKYTQNLHNIYYISGPNIMVESIKKILHGENVKNKDIHTDYFPGF
jgi:ferredoxin-NADP reductase